jgi:hypothetical protein
MMNTKDNSKSSIGSVRHKPTYNSENLNRATDRAINDPNFLNSCMNLLRDLKLPAFKNSIVDHITRATKDSDIISLFETLDGYIEYKHQFHVQKALEENDPKKKAASQMRDETRENPSLKNHRTTVNKNIKNTQAVTESEERKIFRK